MQVPPVPSNYPRESLVADPQKLREIAIAQKQVLYCVLCSFAVGGVRVVSVATHNVPMGVLFDILLIGLIIFELISVSKLAKALGVSSVLYMILMFVPCISLLALVVITEKASKQLKAAGIKVGLMGADPNKI